MKKIVCGLLLVLLCASSAVGNEKHKEYLTAADIAVREGSELIKQGRYDDAYDFYAKHIFKDPSNVNLNLKFAEAAIMAGKYYPAIFTYERMLEKSDDPVVREALIKLYIAVDNMPAAYVEYEKLRASHPEYAENSGLSSKLSSGTGKFRLYGRLSVMGMYDSNANSGTKTGMYNNFTFPSLKEVGSAGVSSTLLLGGSYEMSSKVHLVGDTIFNYRYNFDDRLMNNQDNIWWLTSFGIRHATEMRLIEARIKNDFSRQTNEYDTPVINSPGVDLTYSRLLGKRFINSVVASFEYRDYRDNSDNTGYFYQAEEQIRFIINDNHSASVSGKVYYFDADMQRYSFFGYELSLSYYSVFFNRLTVSPYFIYRYDDYKDEAIILEDFDREDKQIRTGLFASYYFTDYLSADLSFAYIDNDSNSFMYKYDKYIVSAGLSVSF